MRKLCDAVVLALLALATPALAQDKLAAGTTIFLSGAPACDTKEQALSVLRAHAEGGEQAGYARFQQLNALKNDKGDAVCGSVGHPIAPVAVHLVGKVATFPLLNFGGVERDAFIVEVKDGEGTALYVITFRDADTPRPDPAA